MKRLTWFTVVVLTTLVAVALLWVLRDVVLLFLFSLAVAAALRPIVIALVRRGLPESMALILAYVSGAILIGTLIYLISVPLSSEIQRGTDDFAAAYERIKREWPDGTPFQATIAGRLPPSQDLYKALSGEQGNTLLQAFFGFTSGFFEIVTQVVIVLVLSLYWSADRAHFERLWLSVLPAGQRARARDLWRAGEARIGGHIRSEFMQSVLAGLLLGGGYWLIGLRYPALLALIGAIVWLLPMMGIVLAVVPALLIGMMSSLSQGIAAALYTLIILSVLELVVERRLFKQRQLASPILVVLMIMIMADAFGILGLVLAPPLAAAIQTMVGGLAKKQSFATDSTESTPEVSDLHQRLARVQRILARKESAPMEITDLVERLTGLLEKADQAL